MSILTLRELEFVASLKQRWTRLYVDELARLRRELDEPYGLRQRAPRRRQPASLAVKQGAGHPH